MEIDYNQLENTIGYHFRNRDLLQQAFVRRSYSQENGGQNNEVLEFIGDKALDFAVIRLMMEHFGEITTNKGWNELKLKNPKYFQTKIGEGKFTDLKKMLVQKKALSKCMDKLGFHQQLIMGKGDINNNVQEKDSVKEDLFEAIIGAVAVDSDYDMNEITSVVDSMLDLDSFFSNEEFDYYHDNNYVGWLQEWSQSKGYGLPDYEYRFTDEGEYYCEVSIYGCRRLISPVAQGYGSSQAKARSEAAFKAFTYLRKNGYIGNDFEDAVGEPILEESIRQMNELKAKGLISDFNYDFEQSYNSNGDSIWTCSLKTKGYDRIEYGMGYSKKEAQRKAAYDFLTYLMGYEVEE